MFPWTKLPNELRHEVVKRMDFISRFRFRGVSKTDKKLVDSIPLNIPRVCFQLKGEKKAVMNIFLSIDKGFAVIFEEIGDRVVEVTRYADWVHKGKTRRFIGVNLLTLSAQNLASATMSPNTTLGGFEFMYDVLTLENSCLMDDVIGSKRCRTKILTIENGCWAFILTHCSFSDLLEVQIIGSPIPQEDDRLRMVCFTKRDEYRMNANGGREGAGRLFCTRNYVPMDFENLEQLVGSKSKFQQALKRLKAEKVAPNCYKYYQPAPNGYAKTEFNSCGVTTELMLAKMERKDPSICGMRWACAKHSDPFEHAYYTNLLKPTEYEDIDFGLVAVSGMPVFCELVHPIINGTSSLDFMMKATYEHFKNVSKCMGISVGNFEPRDAMRGDVGRFQTKVVRLSRGLVRAGSDDLRDAGGEAETRSVIYELKPEVARQVQEELKVSDDSGSEVSSEESELESVGSESDSEVSDEGSLESDMESKGSEALKVAVGGEILEALKVLEELESEGLEAGEEAQEALKVLDQLESEGLEHLKIAAAAGEVQKDSKVSAALESKESKVLESKRSEAGGEVLEALKVSDELESKGSEVLKVSAGEVQKDLKVSAALESDDSDAENPFNTEEFKAKFNKSNSDDQSWTIFMIFAVLSIAFSFFLTFFFF